MSKENVTGVNTLSLPVEKVWKIWTKPEHINKWNNAFPEWHTRDATNDLVAGGKFSYSEGW